MSLSLRGDFDVRKSLLRNHDCVLPQSSPLTKIIARYWDNWKNVKHCWWSAEYLHHVLSSILLFNSSRHTTSSIEFDQNSTIAIILDSTRIEKKDVMRIVQQEVLYINRLSLEELTSFYNPLCPCPMCRQDYDVCGNM